MLPARERLLERHLPTVEEKPLHHGFLTAFTVYFSAAPIKKPQIKINFSSTDSLVRSPGPSPLGRPREEDGVPEKQQGTRGNYCRKWAKQ
jgi:hypothetical protein